MERRDGWGWRGLRAGSVVGGIGIVGRYIHESPQQRLCLHNGD